ncbi:MAG TPA: DRTGG domain-containing protein [Rectinemataceae bacterium]|nr:DRTGG domain-containing protein [Rectinemataceae bacterium]
MKVSDIATTLDAKVFAGEKQLDLEVQSACGADLMSDVMAFVKERVVLLTGLMNPQALRTADLLDIKVIVFVRGKKPTPDLVEMANESNMILMTTKYSMFLACGRLYEAGLKAGGIREIS